MATPQLISLQMQILCHNWCFVRVLKGSEYPSPQFPYEGDLNSFTLMEEGPGLWDFLKYFSTNRSTIIPMGFKDLTHGYSSCFLAGHCIILLIPSAIEILHLLLSFVSVGNGWLLRGHCISIIITQNEVGYDYVTLLYKILQGLPTVCSVRHKSLSE